MQKSACIFSVHSQKHKSQHQYYDKKDLALSVNKSQISYLINKDLIKSTFWYAALIYSHYTATEIIRSQNIHFTQIDP